MAPRSLRRENGFTLVELLVTIVILGVMAGVVVFAVGGIGDRGGASACAQDHRTISTAIEAYRAQHDNAAPAALTDLTEDNRYLRADSSLSATQKVGEGYTLTYSGGTLTDCPPALAVGGDGGPGGGGPAMTATALVVNGPTSWTAGVAQSVTVTAARTDGTTDTTYDGVFTFGGSAWVVSPAVRASAPQGERSLSGGQATFAVTLKQAGTGLALVASSADLPSAPLTGLDVAPAMTTLSFVNPDCGDLGPGNRPWSSAVNRGVDAFGNSARASAAVTVAIARSPGAAGATNIPAGSMNSDVITTNIPNNTPSITVTASASGYASTSCTMTH